MAKRRGFPPVYKIERVEKLSAKRVFFGVFQKIMVICCAIFFGFANAFSANLPAGYTELEYIESTGEQWIDTGVSGAATWNITAQSESFTTTGNKVLVARGSNGPTWFGAVKDTGNFGAGATASSSVSYTTKADMVINFASDSISGTINGEGFNRTGSATAFNNNYELFGFGGSYLFIGKLFVAKAYQNNTLVRNLIPAKNSSGVVGMYDTVGGQFYTSRGTGEFTAGPVVGIRIATTAYNAARFSQVKTDLNSAVATIREIVTKTINQTAAIASLQADKQTRPEDACPAGKKCLLVETEENGVVVPHWFPIVENICGVPSGYTCLDYIQASGTQYIDTGIVPTLTSGAHIRAKFLALKSSDNIIFGATDSTAFAGGSPFSIDVFTNRVLMPFGGGANNSVNYSPMISKTMETNVLYDFKLNYLNDKKASVNDTQVTYSNPVSMTSRSLLLFNLNSSAGGMSQYAATKSQIFSAVITDGSNIVFNGVPAKRDSDGVIGVYDTVNDRFLTNAGTGTFTAGPEI